MLHQQNCQTKMEDNPELRRWTEVGVAASDAGQQGPIVFRWQRPTVLGRGLLGESSLRSSLGLILHSGFAAVAISCHMTG